MSYSVVNAIFSTSSKSEPHSTVPISPQTKAVTIVLLVLSVSFLTGGVEPRAEFLEDGIVICIWMALATMMLIIFTNACLNVTGGRVQAESDCSGTEDKHMGQAAS
jgi:hypothetical protein